jgi:plasmid maintenance system antidote protein VapI
LSVRNLGTSSLREERISAALREQVVREVGQRDIKEVARLIGMAPPAAQALLSGDGWSLELAFRIADRLDLAQLDDLENALAPR